MKAILEFDLDNIEDRKAHKRAVSSTDAYLSILDFQDYLRSRLKYEEMSEEKNDTLEQVRNALFQCLSSRNINMDDLE